LIHRSVVAKAVPCANHQRRSGQRAPGQAQDRLELVFVGIHQGVFVLHAGQAAHWIAGQHRGDLSTINGSILVGSDAVVGQVKTVNGNVKVESRATSKTLTTVNGSITAHDGVRVQGNLNAVSGALRVTNGADVSGDVINVSGGIHVESAHVGGNVDTCAGGIDLGPNARVDGNVIVEKDNSWHFGFGNVPPPVHVVIGPGTVVKGTLRFERPVKLYVSDHATIGAVQGAEVIKFSGEHPPE